MTPLTGWIKFHRKTMNSATWSLSPGQFKVWAACLLMANNTNRSWFDGAGEVEIPRGSFVTSEPKLAEVAKVTRRVVQGALVNLHRIGSIRYKRRAKKWTLIEVVNFDTYQGSEWVEGQEEVQVRDKYGTSKGHNVRMKNEEREKRTPPLSFDEQAFWEKFPPQDQEVIRQTIEAIHTTRKRGRVASSVIQAEMKWWDQQDPAQVVQGMQIYLQKGYAAQGKCEAYLRGIIRNSDGQTPQLAPSREANKSPGHLAIQRAAMSMTREDCSD